MFECVPQSDFDDIDPAKLVVEGDAYNWYLAYQCYCLSVESDDTEQRRQLWNSMGRNDREAHYEAESHDRGRAFVHRARLIEAMAVSSSCMTYACSDEVTFGAVWDLDVFWVRQDATVWAFGDSPASVIEMIAEYSEADVVMLRKLFVLGELRAHNAK